MKNVKHNENPYRTLAAAIDSDTDTAVAAS